MAGHVGSDATKGFPAGSRGTGTDKRKGAPGGGRDQSLPGDPTRDGGGDERRFMPWRDRNRLTNWVILAYAIVGWRAVTDFLICLFLWDESKYGLLAVLALAFTVDACMMWNNRKRTWSIALPLAATAVAVAVQFTPYRSLDVLILPIAYAMVLLALLARKNGVSAYSLLGKGKPAKWGKSLVSASRERHPVTNALLGLFLIANIAVLAMEVHGIIGVR